MVGRSLLELVVLGEAEEVAVLHLQQVLHLAMVQAVCRVPRQAARCVLAGERSCGAALTLACLMDTIEARLPLQGGDVVAAWLRVFCGGCVVVVGVTVGRLSLPPWPPRGDLPSALLSLKKTL